MQQLYRLARLYNVETEYVDMYGHTQQASPEALIAVLNILGAAIENMDDVTNAIRERRLELCKRFIEPVVVVRQGMQATANICMPAYSESSSVSCRISLENGETIGWTAPIGKSPITRSATAEGTRYSYRKISLPRDLPLGYHRLTIDFQDHTHETLVIASPGKACTSIQGRRGQEHWGIFIPLYSLHSERSWGAGDLSDLDRLTAWISGLGGKIVATLPLLPAFLDKPFEPCPYVPVSRLFWNDFYLDIEQIPELEICPEAQELINSAAFVKPVNRLRRSPQVDYRRQMALKRKVLEQLSKCFFSSTGNTGDFRNFVKNNPLIEDYARFCAVSDKYRTPWQIWPKRVREGHISPRHFDENEMRYHLYTQWQTSRQIQAVTRKMRDSDTILYLDFPLGVHPSGYDTWRFRDTFAMEISTGAPPDTFFTLGQNWGSPPFHPERLRQQHYKYYISSIQHHLKHSNLLRIDHVMGLHRLFWIPKGMEAKQGVYVRYPSEELYAILSLESVRHKAVIAGEDLGTVPPQVRPAMSRHGIYRTYVVQYDLHSCRNGGSLDIPRDSVASINNHDMPAFAAYWRGDDIQMRKEMGLLDDGGVDHEYWMRGEIKKALLDFLNRMGCDGLNTDDVEAALGATHRFLAGCPAKIVLINLEDLWLETLNQNVPGTRDEFPNWRRKTRYTLEQFSNMPQIAEQLRGINQQRKLRLK